MLDALPDVALDEVLEAFSHVWAFYQPVKPEIADAPKARKGKITRRYERPAYTIED